MLLRHGLGLVDAAEVLDQGVRSVLDAGGRTRDLVRPGEPVLGTREFGDRVVRAVRARVEAGGAAAKEQAAAAP
jgi:isocitrate/isopropylmalate dehydrogenase